MDTKNTFQLILGGVFLVAIVLAVILFAGQKSSTRVASSTNQPSITMWGTLDSGSMSQFIGSGVLGAYDVRYTQFDDNEFYTELVDALASGKGPDLIMITGEDILRHYDRLTPMPYESFPLSAYEGLFTDPAGVFLLPEGIYAFPTMLDPLVMYYNKDILASEFLLEAPTTWQEVVDLVPKFTRKTDTGTILQSTIALGTGPNLKYADAIISMLMMQLGSPMVGFSDLGYESALSVNSANSGVITGVSPAFAGLEFFTSFADSQNSHYTWNASFSSAKDAFLAGDLVLYIGYGSEAPSLRQQNPNLNFGVAVVPQLSDTNRKITYGRVYGLAVTRTTPHITESFGIANLFVSEPAARAFSQAFSTAPLLTNLLTEVPDDPYTKVLYQSAIIARSWPRPGYDATKKLFEDLITDVYSGRDTLDNLVDVLDNRLNDLLRRYAPKPLRPVDETAEELGAL